MLQNNIYKQKLSFVFVVCYYFCESMATLFTKVGRTICSNVIYFCKQFAKNDYFDLNGILYSFAAENA